MQQWTLWRSGLRKSTLKDCNGILFRKYILTSLTGGTASLLEIQQNLRYGTR